MKTKLTLVSVSVKGNPVAVFVNAPQNEKGQTVISPKLYDALSRKAGAFPGDTVTKG